MLNYSNYSDSVPLPDGMHAFVASWCGHCQALIPELFALKKKLDKVQCGDLLHVYDGEQQLPKRRDMKVSAFPTMFVTKNNRVVDAPEDRTRDGLFKTMVVNFKSKMKQMFGYGDDDEGPDKADKLVDLIESNPEVQRLLCRRVISKLAVSRAGRKLIRDLLMED